MKSRILQAFLLIVIFLIGVVLLNSLRNSDSAPSSSEQSLDPSP